LRGVVVNALLKEMPVAAAKAFTAVVVASVLFGLVKMTKLLAGRKPLINNFDQVVSAFSLGFIFAA
jgi:membrane protease YdiL (CAAX protease family)